MTQSENLDILVTITHRQEPQYGERVRDGEIHQAKKHERSACRTKFPAWTGRDRLCQSGLRKAMTWPDGIVGRRTAEQPNHDQIQEMERHKN